MATRCLTTGRVLTSVGMMQFRNFRNPALTASRILSFRSVLTGSTRPPLVMHGLAQSIRTVSTSPSANTKPKPPKHAMLSLEKKVPAPPMVYIAGEEMTRYACQLIMDKWFAPYFDLSAWQHFDLSCQHRDATNDQVLHDAVAAGKKVGSIFKVREKKEGGHWLRFIWFPCQKNQRVFCAVGSLLIANLPNHE